jgi:hypothetical protein
VGVVVVVVVEEPWPCAWGEGGGRTGDSASGKGTGRGAAFLSRFDCCFSAFLLSGGEVVVEAPAASFSPVVPAAAPAAPPAPSVPDEEEEGESFGLTYLSGALPGAPPSRMPFLPLPAFLLPPLPLTALRNRAVRPTTWTVRRLARLKRRRRRPPFLSLLLLLALVLSCEKGEGDWPVSSLS